MAPWHDLPTEMKLQVVDHLTSEEVKLFSRADIETYSLCVPSLFREITLHNYEGLHAFLVQVPQSYHRHIRTLSVRIKPDSPRNMRACIANQTKLLITLLSASTAVEQLILHLYGSPAKDIIPCFRHLTSLKSLHISNCGDEHSLPLSERLVVSVALSVPRLEELTIERVARSCMHAPDLIGSYPYVPLVSGDEDIEDHPIVGSKLCLPSVLQIPTLMKLRIRDTHLGDPFWETAPCISPLICVDLGSYYHVTQNSSSVYIEQIINNIAKHCNITDLSINTTLEGSHFRQSITPLKHLRHLRLTSFFPVDCVADTLATLSGSPIEKLCIQCYEDDIVDVCLSIEQFLDFRMECGSGVFYEHLKELVISFVPIEGDMGVPASLVSTSSPCSNSVSVEQVEATRRFEERCKDMGLKASTEDSVGSLTGACIIKLSSQLTTGKEENDGVRKVR